MTEDSGAPPRRLTRSQEGRLITGVCAGLARYTRIDPVVFRLGFALLVLTTGVGVLLYIGAFLLMAAPDGGPSKIERLGHRLFDGDTALALLGAALGAGTLLGTVGDWGSPNALAAVVVFVLVLFAARSRGVDLVGLARGLPERAKGRPLSSWTPPAAPAPPPYRAPDGMIDLARLARTEPLEAEPPPPSPPTPSPIVTPRRRSYLTVCTLVTAVLVASVLYAAGDRRPDLGRLQIIIAGALVVVAAGLFVGSWFGRDRKLITVGAIMSLALASTSIAGDPAIARRTHATAWRPADVSQAEQSHKVLIGEGTVDLTSVPLVPGQRLRVTATVRLGVLTVRLPATARVELDAQAFLGDITVDRQITSGPRARVNRVLDPEVPPAGAAPVIALRLRSTVGDMEVARVPA
ncbi:PspC domain-containing protein [Actinoallomurus purpureus]|uniref:PspC domain-containing protein n=1 Tax=Actinoallomurus purpureus TaxID=478114 RepID=UPI002091FB29|nr:PspC domain-containing protein [Actinoallomurus purpureus]MCO6004677.1 PspC domain-containing protein [Actinoallomurus purpureus]